MNLKAKEGCCEEASVMSHNFYIPCNQPATKRVYHDRDKREYRMCDACAWHNIKNRGAQDRGAFDPEPTLGTILGDAYEQDCTEEMIRMRDPVRGIIPSFEDVANRWMKACEKLEAINKELVEALQRQSENMAFVLNNCDVASFYDQFIKDLEEDRAAIAKATGAL